jgi:hypothetical protein
LAVLRLHVCLVLIDRINPTRTPPPPPPPHTHTHTQFDLWPFVCPPCPSSPPSVLFHILRTHSHLRLFFRAQDQHVIRLLFTMLFKEPSGRLLQVLYAAHTLVHLLYHQRRLLPLCYDDNQSGLDAGCIVYSLVRNDDVMRCLYQHVLPCA